MKSKLLCIALGTLLAVPAISSATLLNFDGLGLPNYGDIPTNLGSFASAPVTGVAQGSGWTPNVAVAMSSVLPDGSLGASNLEFWSTGYGDLTDIAFSVQSGWYGRVALTAQAGFDVTINAFDLGGWPSSNLNASRIRIYDGLGNILWNQDNTVVNGANFTHSTYTPNITGQTLILEYGDNWNIGLDNLNFTQTAAVPEPASIAVLGIGLAAFARRKRK